MKAKTIKLRSEGKTYVAKTIHLYLTDDTGSGCSSYNHPVIEVVFAREGTDGEGYGDSFRAGFNFQRNLKSPDDKYFHPADPTMATRRSWSGAYGGHATLSKSGRHDIRDMAFRLCPEDQMRVDLARKVAREIREGNLDRVHPDDGAAQVWAALERLAGDTLTERHYKATLEERGPWKRLAEVRRGWADQDRHRAHASEPLDLLSGRHSAS